MSATAETIVSVLLENEKWDKTWSTTRELWKMHQKRDKLFRELTRSIAYHRALSHAGVRKEDVAHPIRGAQVGATDNFKWKVPAKQCQQPYCGTNMRYYPLSATTCPRCQEPLVGTDKPISSSDLRGAWANYIVGVELNDGRRVMLKEPVPPQPWLDWEKED